MYYQLILKIDGRQCKLAFWTFMDYLTIYDNKAEESSYSSIDENRPKLEVNPINESRLHSEINDPNIEFCGEYYGTEHYKNL